jgi:hypothetical protein
MNSKVAKESSRELILVLPVSSIVTKKNFDFFFHISLSELLWIFEDF